MILHMEIGLSILPDCHAHILLLVGIGTYDLACDWQFKFLKTMDKLQGRTQVTRQTQLLD